MSAHPHVSLDLAEIELEGYGPFRDKQVRRAWGL